MTIRFHNLSHDPHTHRFALGESFSGKVSFEAEVAGRWHTLGLDQGHAQDKTDGRQKGIKQEVLIDVVGGETVTFPFSVIPNPEAGFSGLGDASVEYLVAQAIPTEGSERRPVLKKMGLKVLPARPARIDDKRFALSPPLPGFWKYLFAFLGVSLSSLILADKLFLLLATLYWGTYIAAVRYWKKGLEHVGAVVVQPLQTSPESLVVEVAFPGEERSFRSISACYEVHEVVKNTDSDGVTADTRFLKFRSADVEKIRGDHPYSCEFRIPRNLPLPGDAGKRIRWVVKVKVRHSNLRAYTYEGKLKVQ